MHNETPEEPRRAASVIASIIGALTFLALGLWLRQTWPIVGFLFLILAVSHVFRAVYHTWKINQD